MKVVDGTPEACVTLLQSYLTRDWPHGGKWTRPQAAIRIWAPRRDLFSTPQGIVLLTLLSLVTAGAFIALYGIYWFMLYASKRSVYEALITATPEGPNKTRLEVTASRQEWAQTLEQWIQEELVEKRAAADLEVPPYSAPQHGLFHHRDGGPDIPEQIKKLAELRDSGAISAEEFEAKKRDLLDRM
jgi:hypothetical protein